jgi:HEAT repeat protein
MVMNEHISGLISAIHDDREGLRLFAVKRLVKMDPQVVIPALLQLLQERNENTQEAAAIGLATFGDNAIPHLLEALKSDNRRIRWGAAWVLASMGPQARNALPAVKITADQRPSGSSTALPRPSQSGVWSDSWLTKVREQLAAAKGLDPLGVSAPRLAPGPGSC